MQKILFEKKAGAKCRILCLGAHSDDIEIGCGGTILRLIRDQKNLEFYWMVFSGNRQREEEARKSALLFLRSVRRKTVVTKAFRDGFFPYTGFEIKESFEQLKKEFSPDIIFTHYRDDRHQDHRLISELTWNTFRHHLIVEYETPKYDGDLGSPNFFVELGESLCRKKSEYILSCFGSQREKHWLTEDTIMSLLRLRGIESGGSAKYAEAFYCRKIIY